MHFKAIVMHTVGLTSGVILSSVTVMLYTVAK